MKRIGKTKEKILAAALRQFNESGTDAVTVRSVADEVGISHGNLCYHFKNTDVLIEALYHQLVAEVEQHAIRAQDPAIGLAVMYEQVEASCRLLYRYRFLMLDFVRINRRIPSIRAHFRQLMQLRRRQFQVGLDNLARAGILRASTAEAPYDQLIRQVLILGDAWIPHAEIHHDESGETVIRDYARLIFGMLAPYFTGNGLREYEKVIRGDDRRMP